MAFTYYPGGSGTTVTNPPYSLLTPIKVTSTPAIFTPRVATSTQNAQSFGQGGALPFNFEVGTDINAILVSYSNNKPRDGFTFNGNPGINPGWQLRCFVFNTDSVTGLPTTLRNDLGVQYLQNTSDGASENGLVGWEFGNYVPANTPIWVLIAAQPKWDSNLPNGFFDGTTYSWDGSNWNQDNAGGHIVAPNSTSWSTELDPIISLPLLEKSIYAFGNNPVKLNVASNYGPMYDYSGFGGPTAINLATSTAPTTWAGDFDFITSQTFAYEAGNNGLLPIIEAIID